MKSSSKRRCVSACATPSCSSRARRLRSSSIEISRTRENKRAFSTATATSSPSRCKSALFESWRCSSGHAARSSPCGIPSCRIGATSQQSKSPSAAALSGCSSSRRTTVALPWMTDPRPAVGSRTSTLDGSRNPYELTTAYVPASWISTAAALDRIASLISCTAASATVPISKPPGSDRAIR